MPTAISVGNTNFREVARSLTVNRVAIDSLTVTLRGRSSALLDAWKTYDPGERDSVYSNMYLESKSFTDQGPVSEITLNYSGIASADPAAEGENSITLQSVSLTSDEGDNVTFSYFAQSSTTRWIAKLRLPMQPKYRGQPPSSIPTEQLFNPSPPDYSGSISGQYNAVQRLTSFTRSQVAPQVWVVTETWETMIEPKT